MPKFRTTPMQFDVQWHLWCDPPTLAATAMHHAPICSGARFDKLTAWPDQHILAAFSTEYSPAMRAPFQTERPAADLSQRDRRLGSTDPVSGPGRSTMPVAPDHNLPSGGCRGAVDCTRRGQRGIVDCSAGDPRSSGRCGCAVCRRAHKKCRAAAPRYERERHSRVWCGRRSDGPRRSGPIMVTPARCRLWQKRICK